MIDLCMFYVRTFMFCMGMKRGETYCVMMVVCSCAYNRMSENWTCGKGKELEMHACMHVCTHQDDDTWLGPLATHLLQPALCNEDLHVHVTWT